jgi:hypothetical protein
LVHDVAGLLKKRLEQNSGGSGLTRFAKDKTIRYGLYGRDLSASDKSGTELKGR